MRKSLLNLTHAFPEHIHIETDLQATGEPEYDINCELEIGQNKEQQRLWRVCLDTRFGGKDGAKTAYRGRVRYVGFFSVDETIPSEAMERIIAVTAPSILYSSIRELVALLTGRGRGSCVLLPVVSFLDNLAPTFLESPQLPLSRAPSPRTKNLPRKSAKTMGGAAGK